MKKAYSFKILITILSIITLSFSNCKQPDNPKYLGKEYGKFDLSKLTFDENMDTIFSKIDHITSLRPSNEGSIQILKIKNFSEVNNIFYFYGLKLNNLEFFIDNSPKKLLAITDLVFVSSDEADNFINNVKKSKHYQEIPVEKDERIDKYFIGNNQYSLLEITKTLFNKDQPKGNCQVMVQIYKYPQTADLIKGTVIMNLKTIEILNNSMIKNIPNKNK